MTSVARGASTEGLRTQLHAFRTMTTSSFEDDYTARAQLDVGRIRRQAVVADDPRDRLPRRAPHARPAESKSMRAV